MFVGHELPGLLVDLLALLQEPVDLALMTIPTVTITVIVTTMVTSVTCSVKYYIQYILYTIYSI